MTQKKEYTGKDVEHAIKIACKDLSVTSDALDIEVVSAGSTGIFGLCRRDAKIRASLKSGDEPAKTDETVKPVRPKRDSHPQKKRRQDRPSAGPVEERTARTEKADFEDEDDDMRGEPAMVFDDDLIETIRVELRKFLEMLDMPGESAANVDENGLTLRITSERVDEIIGPEGQVLDSIQYLLRKVLSKRLGKKIMFSLDAGDYRALRQKELEDLARRLRDEVLKTGRSATISALNPAERRIIHMTLQDDSTVKSRSLGDGIYKKIMIYLPGRPKKKGGYKQGRSGGRRRKNSQAPRE